MTVRIERKLTKEEIERRALTVDKEHWKKVPHLGVTFTVHANERTFVTRIHQDKNCACSSKVHEHRWIPYLEPLVAYLPGAKASLRSERSSHYVLELSGKQRAQPTVSLHALNIQPAGTNLRPKAMKVAALRPDQVVVPKSGRKITPLRAKPVSVDLRRAAGRPRARGALRVKPGKVEFRRAPKPRRASPLRPQKVRLDIRAAAGKPKPAARRLKSVRAELRPARARQLRAPFQVKLGTPVVRTARGPPLTWNGSPKKVKKARRR